MKPFSFPKCQHFLTKHFLNLIVAAIFVAPIFSNAQNSEPTPPYNPCASSSIPSGCFDGTRTCQYYSQYPCSYGYCWANGTTTINQGIPLGGGLVENKTIEIGGAYTITQNVMFKNCIFKMHGDAVINISPVGIGNSVVNVFFEQCNFFGCNEMWQGIVVNTNNTTGNLMLTIYGCNIEDAYIGVTLDEVRGNYVFSKNTFRNNHIGVSNSRKNGLGLNAAFALNTFLQSAPLALINPNGPLGGLTLPDYPNSHAGIKYYNVNATIGRIGGSNLFTCLENGIVALNGGRIEAISDIFQNIGQNGIWVNDILNLSAKVCTFKLEGELCIRANNSSLNIGRNTFTGNWREGIHSTANAGNQYITINDKNIFNFTGGKWEGAIYVERPQGTTLFDSKIDDNTFTANAAPDQNLFCIHVVDMADAPNKFVISNNILDFNFSLNGTIVPHVIGIWTQLGDSDNFIVTGNHMTFHVPTDASGWGFFITYFGPGQNTSIGHYFGHNSVIGPPNNYLTVVEGFTVFPVENVEFCDNTVDWSLLGFNCGGLSDIILRQNHFNHHFIGLNISGGQIGPQIGRGNTWDSPIDVAEFAASNNGPNPLNSEIIVNETQEGNVLPWLPPSGNIFPDPTVGINWFHTAPNPPLDYCVPMFSPGPHKLTQYEKALVSGISPLTGTSLWDLKHEVYFKLLVFPELRPPGSPEATFFNSLSNSCIASLSQTQLLVRNALLQSSSGQQTTYNYAMAALDALPAIESFDAATDFSNLNSFTESWYNQRAALLQQFAANATNEATMKTSSLQQLNIALQSALNYNASISTVQPNEAASKLFNELRIRNLMRQPISQSLYQQTLAAAQQGVEIVGKSAKDLITFLAPCDQSQFLQPVEMSERRNAYLQKTNVQRRNLVLTPNPSTGRLDIMLDQTEDEEVYISVYSIYGSKVMTLNIVPGTSKVELDMTSATTGLYWVILSNESGKIVNKAQLLLIR